MRIIIFLSAMLIAASQNIVYMRNHMGEIILIAIFAFALDVFEIYRKKDL